MNIIENPTVTDTRKFLVQDGNKEYIVYIPHCFNCIDPAVYETTNVSDTKKGMEIIAACQDYAFRNKAKRLYVRTEEVAKC